MALYVIRARVQLDRVPNLSHTVCPQLNNYSEQNMQRKKTLEIAFKTIQHDMIMPTLVFNKSVNIHGLVGEYPLCLNKNAKTALSISLPDKPPIPLL